MIEFIESIRLENGRLHHLDLHQRRLDLTTLAHYGMSIRLDLKTALEARSLPQEGLYKIRVTYAREIGGIAIESYHRRSVEGITLVEAPGVDYRFKYAERSVLNHFAAGLPPGVEPLLVQNGLLTDGLYANLCFYDGVRWLTPEKPLLPGVAREAALAAGEIFPGEISAADVAAGKYPQVKLINCMTLFAEAAPVSAALL